MTVKFQVRRRLGLQARHLNFLALSKVEASANQNEIDGVGTRHVNGVRPQERALSGGQENKALPVAESRPGDPLIEDGNDPALLLGPSRLDAKPQQGEQARSQARKSREGALPSNYASIRRAWRIIKFWFCPSKVIASGCSTSPWRRGTGDRFGSFAPVS